MVISMSTILKKQYGRRIFQNGMCVVLSVSDFGVLFSPSRYMVLDMPHGSVLRIDPVKANRDDTSFDCVADNGIGEPAIASASLTVYPEGAGEIAQFLPSTKK